ncbi:unnamed protein product [Prorocentrum cordatum]|uniref:Thioredoxin domain-containing protein n=1 Tax=Prorocentrum cordatum TaxID=2364126 RepID=A0ABN9W028_9DINO|nr:unnamed protein product [Polarella glacialis]
MGIFGSKAREAAASEEAPAGGLEELFGTELLTKEGPKKTSEVLGGKRAVLVYFSAHWCPPCRGFTPVLAQAYEAHSQGDVAVVFVSADQTQPQFESYFGSMPWCALPFSAGKIKSKLNTMYGE